MKLRTNTVSLALLVLLCQCATKGAENQWMQVPPEDLSVRLGSGPSSVCGNAAGEALGALPR
jgi:hypothetical protein